MSKNSGFYPPIFSRVSGTGYDPKILVKKTVSIFGVGGIGALLAEILVRAGVGEIILVDKDRVEEENLNRIGFYPSEIGQPKVDALYERLVQFRNVRTESFPLVIKKYFVNIFTFDELETVVKDSDCILSALDDIDARLELNAVVLRYKKILIDGGASTNGRRGRVTVVKPFSWPCLACYYSSDSLVGDIFEEVSCNVSLATTMAIIAAIQADFCLRALLGLKGLVPLVLINLEDNIGLIKYENLKPRGDCPHCGRYIKND